MFWDRNKKMMMENARTVRRSVDANEQARERKRAKTTPLRNEAQLNCVVLRSELDCEVTYGAVKGQDERRPSAAPLTAPQVTPELDAARKKTSRLHGKTDKTGGTVGRPSCQSSLLSDPNAKFSVEMWQKPPRTRSKKNKKRRDGGTDVPNEKKTEIKQRRAATSALTFMTFS
jgi:hypothetical protein